MPSVKVAVFPAAGLGTRFLPATKAQPKEMLPLVDRPLVQYVVEEAKAAGSGFDAVLLDLTVGGGMGGMETAARLKEVDPAAILIVSSGYSDSPVMSDIARYGFAGVLPKPWTGAQLSEVFRKVLVKDRDNKVE